MLCTRMINEPLRTIWGIEYDLEIVMMGTGLHATVQAYQSPTDIGCACVVGPD